MNETPQLLACPSCDLLQKVPSVTARQRARCIRCGHTVREHHGYDAQVNLALATTVLVLLLIANYFPIMDMELEGQFQSTTVLSGVVALWQAGRAETALLVLAVTIVVPFARAVAVFVVSIPLLREPARRRHARALRFIARLSPWGMTEVYLLGALVAFVKLDDLATVEPGPALYAFAALSIFSALSTRHLDGHSAWAPSA